MTATIGTRKSLIFATVAIALAGCGDVDWEESAREACDADTAVCDCMVTEIVEGYDGDEERRLLAALAVGFENPDMTVEEAAEALEMSTTDFAAFREESTRTLDRLRRRCEAS